jgi:hypothetical protein
MAGRLNKKKINAKNVICGIFQNSNWGWESKNRRITGGRPWRIPTDGDVFIIIVWLDGYVSDGW